MEVKLTWQERRDLLTEDQRRGKVPNKYGRNQGDFGDISPFVESIIHYWLDGFDIPRINKI